MTAWRYRWYTVPLLIFVAARTISALVLTLVGSRQQASSIVTDSPYLAMSANWDSYWYYSIAENGYPAQIGPGPVSVYEQSEWAFYPAWPSVLQLFSLGGTLSIPIVASVVVLLLGLAAVLVWHKWVLDATGNTKLATVLTLWLSLYPATTVLHMGYSEALALLLLGLIFLALHHRRFVLVLLPLTMLSLTRPITLALVLVFLFLALRNTGRARTVYASLSAYTLATFAFWPMVVGLELGRADAYLQVQKAWSAGSAGSPLAYLVSGDANLVPVVFTLAIAWLAYLGIRRAPYPLILKVWACSYLLYLGLFSEAAYFADAYGFALPQDATHTRFNGSLIRYVYLAVLPLLPIYWVRHRAVWAGVVGAGLLGITAHAMFFVGYGVVAEPLWP